MVQGGSNGTTGAPLPAGVVDHTAGGFNPSGTTGTVFLASGATAINPDSQAEQVIDKVGFGGSNTTPGSIGRTSVDDTNNNAVDFAFSGTPTPDALNTGQNADAPAPSPSPTPTPEPTPTPSAECTKVHKWKSPHPGCEPKKPKKPKYLPFR